MNNIYVVLLFTLSATALLSIILWEAFGAIKNKDNSNGSNTVATKAKAISAKAAVLFLVGWSLFAIIVKGVLNLIDGYTL